MKFSTHEIARATSAQIFGHPGTDLTEYFIFDSRSLAFPKTTMFIALRTRAADGHRHLASLCAAGVKLFLVEDVPTWHNDFPDCCFLKVDNTFRALEQLAAEARKRIKGKVVAITGSQGKTVVKEMIFSLAPDSVWRSPRSWNSRLGVPMSLLEAKEDSPICVFEAGIDRPGDMDALRGLLLPDVGVFTGLTDEHASGFESDRQKLQEKMRLFKNVPIVVGNTSSRLVDETFRTSGDIRNFVAIRALDNMQTDRLLAETVLGECGVEPPDVDVPEVSNRLDVHQGVNECTIVFDGFTNDMRSLQASLDFMRRRSSAHLSTTVILGDIIDADPVALPRLLTAFGVSRVIVAGQRGAASLAGAKVPFTIEAVASASAFAENYDINQFSSENILIAGGPGKDFVAIKKLLESARHDTIFEINLDAITHNFNTYRQMVKPTTGIIAMVKASAYGLGALEIGRTLQAQGASYLAVAVIDEALELRRGGITMPIMVLNPVTTNYRALFNNDLEPSVFSIGELRTLVKEARRAGIGRFRAHIKLDTGMHRVGFTEAELGALTEALQESPELEVASIFSHLATADCPEQSDYTMEQLQRFERMSNKIMSTLPYPVKRHILNTAGIATHPEYQYDMVRLGIGLYGVNPLPKLKTDLRPTATLRTTVISLKNWPAGTSVGYARRGMLTRDSIVATIPIGYADGLDRHLSRGAASMIVRGVECPVLGNICMDQCMIDVTDVPGVALGDSVEVFGSSQPVEKIADVLDTIPYEVLTSVSPRVKRIYYRD